MIEREHFAALVKTVATLADAGNEMRAQLSALQVLFTAASGVIAEHPDLRDPFARAIAAAAEADQAVALGSRVPDDALLQCEEWTERLTPPSIRPLVQQYRASISG